jgi:hypothetical protein
MAIVTANRMADEVDVKRKTYRQALRRQNFPWHVRYSKWKVREGSSEHDDMRRVLATLRVGYATDLLTNMGRSR